MKCTRRIKLYYDRDDRYLRSKNQMIRQGRELIESKIEMKKTLTASFEGYVMARADRKEIRENNEGWCLLHLNGFFRNYKGINRDIKDTYIVKLPLADNFPMEFFLKDTMCDYSTNTNFSLECETCLEDMITVPFNDGLRELDNLLATKLDAHNYRNVDEDGNDESCYWAPEFCLWNENHSICFYCCITKINKIEL